MYIYIGSDKFDQFISHFTSHPPSFWTILLPVLAGLFGEKRKFVSFGRKRNTDWLADKDRPVWKRTELSRKIPDEVNRSWPKRLKASGTTESQVSGNETRLREGGEKLLGGGNMLIIGLWNIRPWISQWAFEKASWNESGSWSAAIAAIKSY